MESDIEFSPEVIAAALGNIYRQTFDIRHELEPNFFAATSALFGQAIAEGIADAVQDGTPLPEEAFLRALKQSADVFSAFRTHRMQNDIARQLLDEEGGLKSFSRFARDVQPYIDHRNRAWLRTEYDTAVQRAHLAARWQQFEAERDVLPNLRWEESTSPTPGADHRVFWGTVRPIDDPFWTEHRPGDRWNCKCSLEATDEPTNAIPSAIPPGDRPAPGLDNNPGRDGVLVNDRHPYFPHNCAACPLAKNRLSALFAGLKAGGRKDCMECKWVDRAIDRAELMQLNAHTNKEEFRQTQTEIRGALLQEGTNTYEGKRYYTGHLHSGKKEMKAIVAHCFDGVELEAARLLPNLLPQLKNGRYDPINMRRKNYREKIKSGIRHFVTYEVKVGEEVFELKCEAINHNGIMKEHPYSLKRKKE